MNMLSAIIKMVAFCSNKFFLSCLVSSLSMLAVKIREILFSKFVGMT